MKKVVFLFSIFVLLSCSSSDESSNNSDFNTPAWIQGTWKYSDSGVGFKFSPNNIIILTSPSEQSLQGLIDLGRKGGQTVSVDETTSDNSYSVKLNFYGGQSTTYTFKKLSDSAIEYELYGNAMIYIKQ